MRTVDIFFMLSLQLQVLLEIARFLLHKSGPGAGIIKNVRKGLI